MFALQTCYEPVFLDLLVFGIGFLSSENTPGLPQEPTRGQLGSTEPTDGIIDSIMFGLRTPPGAPHPPGVPRGAIGEGDNTAPHFGKKPPYLHVEFSKSARHQTLPRKLHIPRGPETKSPRRAPAKRYHWEPWGAIGEGSQ